ncbi:MAG TPA: carboxypeptidase-like regulatory domain-containing protein [Candidatus Acidoferrum sp.]
MVEVASCEPSSQNARISAFLDAKPAKGFKVIVFNSSGKPIQTLFANQKGVAVLPKLHPGRYTVQGVAANNMGGAVCLDISSQNTSLASAFSIDFRVMPPPPPTLKEMLSAAKNGQAGQHLRAFEGFVLDPSGAFVSGVTVQVFKKGSGGKKAIKILKTDGAGRFRAQLPDGVYVAVFQAPGFHTQVLATEIKHSNDVRELGITLQLAEST